MDAQSRLDSPRLLRLQDDLAYSGPAVLEGFWQEIAAAGAPLVEPVSSSPDDFHVTFLYRCAPAPSQIGMVSNLAGSMGEFQELFNLPGSDVWYRSYRLPAATLETYQFSVDGENFTDPLNPRKHIFPVDEDTGFGGWESSVLELPGAPPSNWSQPQPGVLSGAVEKHYFHSQILGSRYPVWLYTPPGAQPAGFLLALDGWFYMNLMPLPVILDNLLAAGELPPFSAVLVGSLAFDRERKRDYGCYPPYIDFLSQELLPWARQLIPLPGNPERSAVLGASRGGLMAGYIGLRLPDVFGNVLAQSGSFGWRPEGDPQPDWLARQYAASPPLPLRFYLEAGRLETHMDMVDGFSIDLLASNRTLRDTLLAKGYPVHYREFVGGHSTAIWRATLSAALLSLFGKQTQ